MLFLRAVVPWPGQKPQKIRGADKPGQMPRDENRRKRVPVSYFKKYAQILDRSVYFVKE